jgi:DNA-binding MarR family transcriptional regulator
MSFEPREWKRLEQSARSMLVLHAQVDALSTMVSGLLERHLGSSSEVEHLHVLDYLSRDGDGMSISHLARAMRWSRPTMSRVVNRMIAAGLVEGAVFDDDPRKRTIWLTEAGHRSRVLLLEQVAMELMKVEMHLRGTKVASLREEAHGMVQVLEKLGKKKRKRRG